MNNQQPEKIRLNSKTLDVHSIFNTIQGEGPFSGQRAVFIRLAGCNLQCPMCDTDYTEGRSQMSVEDILLDVGNVGGKTELVVITGGEPFRQDISNLANRLIADGYSVQVETNGTIFIESFPFSKVTIVCSPKTPKLHYKLIPHIDFYKYVISDGLVDSSYLPVNVLGLTYDKPIARPTKGKEVYVQPCDTKDDSGNRKNLDACIEAVMEMGYTLNLQVHKLIGVE